MGWAWERLELGWGRIGRGFVWIAAWADVIGLLLVAVTGALALAHSSQFPSDEAWSKGHPLPPIQIGAGILLVLTQVVLVVKGRRGQRNQELEAACRQVAAYIDDHCPNVPLREVGVHVWTVAGPPFARHLRRSGSFLLPGDRARSGVRWKEGKGVVGAAWEKRTRVVRDLEVIRRRIRSQEQFEALPADERFGLTWDEFRRTPNYKVVSADPLYSRDNRSGQPAVRGVLAIDLLEDGHCEELERAPKILDLLPSWGFAKLLWSHSEGTEMTPEKRAKVEERSLRGSGPRIVSPDLLQRLEREEAPKYLIKAAQRAIKTNPV